MSGRYAQILSLLVILFFMRGSNSAIAKSANLNSAQIADLYSQAKLFFRQANEVAAKDPSQATSLYGKSAMRYERIIREGDIRNGKLYYNLGNIYFRMNEIGRAILNYLRAEQYIPNDSNLKQNLAYVRKNRLDKIEEKQKTKVLKTLFFWHYDIPASIRLIIFTSCFILIWVFASVRVFLKQSIVKYCLVITGVVSVLMAGSLAAEEVSLINNRPGVIISREVVARKGNSDTYEPSFKEPLHSGTEFILREKRGEWLLIELADSRNCWVPSQVVEMVR